MSGFRASISSMLGGTQSPSRSPGRGGSPNKGSPSLSPSTDPSFRRRSNSVQLQSQVESERQEVLSSVKETHSNQFNAVDELSHKLEDTTHNALDMFKRDMPTVVASDAYPASTSMMPLDSPPSNPALSSSSIIITSPTSALPQTRAALGGATLIRTVELAPTSSSPTVATTTTPTPLTPLIPPSPVSSSEANAAALSPMVEAHAPQFQAVDSLSQRLEDTTLSTQDMFKRELPSVVGGRQSSEVAALGTTTSTTAPTTAPTTASSVLLTPVANSAITISPAVVAPTVTTPAMTPLMKTPAVVVDERATPRYGGLEKDAQITGVSASTSSEKDGQIAALQVALIQAKQAYLRAVGDDEGEDVGRPSASALLSTVDADDQSLQSFLHDLPVQRGYLMQRTPSTANTPPTFQRRFATISFDGLILSDNEAGEHPTKIDISRYWLIERGTSRASHDANYASTSAASPLSPLSPVAGKSLLRMEDGAWVLRLVPILTDPSQPHNILEPTRDQVLEFTGSDEAEVSQPDTLMQWVDALNLRISLLALMASPDHQHLLARGGREVLAFLSSLSSHTLRIQHKRVDVSTILHYFKEPLIHRKGWSLTLRNVGMDNEGVRALSEVLMLNHRIDAVDVGGNRITGEGASYLATSLEVNQRLTSLSLDYNEVGQEGLVELAGALAQSQTMTSLSLKGVGLNDDTFTAVVDALVSGVSRTWTKLDLSWNELTDASASALARLLAFSPVASLHLSHNRLGDGLLPALRSAAPSLVSLDLSYNRLTSHSAGALALLLSHSSVSISLTGNEWDSTALVSVLTCGVEVVVEEIRLRSAAAGAPGLGRRMSITKQRVGGSVELIDPLHPKSETQLGRGLEEVSAESKNNVVEVEQKAALDVPATAAATELLVDGGKTAAPRA